MTDQADHKAKMQERQSAQRKKVSELKDPEKGLVLVHTGGTPRTATAMWPPPKPPLPRGAR